MGAVVPASMSRAARFVWPHSAWCEQALGKRSFRAFVERVRPGYIWYRHCEVLGRVLQRVADGELKRVMIFMPPRHGKTELASRLFPSYFLHRYPDRFVGLCSYAQDITNTISRAARENYLAGGGVLKTDAAQIKQWEVEGGGGFWCAGVGGPVTGKGFELGILDDPLKNAEEAASDIIRDKQQEWYQSTFYTREHPGGAIVIIQTRWHERDLSGWLLADEGLSESPERWHIVSLPAIAEEEPSSWPSSCTVEADWREPGEALCPERYDAEKIRQIEQHVGPYHFGALFQQRPRAREGSFFRRPWFKYVAATPVAGARVRAWDLAASEGASADYTAGVLMSYEKESGYFVEDVVHGRWTPGARDDVIAATAAKDGPSVSIWIEQEAGSGGKTQAHSLITRLAGYPVRAEHPTGSKSARADSLASQMEIGNVRFRIAPWNKTVEDEILGFPSAAHDDLVDAIAMAFNKLAAKREITSFY